MLDIRPLSEALQKVAIEELNENPDTIEEDINALRTWIEQQPHLRARTSDQFLLTFLRGCKYSLEKAKAKLDKFYTLREKYPDFLKIPDLDELKVRELIRCGIILYLPAPLNDSGARLAIVRNGAYSTDQFSFAEIAQVRQLMQEIIMLEDDHAVISGLVFVMDFAQVTASHFFQASPGNMRKVSQFSEEALPLRIKATHFIDTPAGFEPVFNMLKPLMSEKMKSRIFVHGNKREELFKVVPKKLLPVEYGGENGNLQDLIDYWEHKIYSYKEYFEQDSNYGTDEVLRRTKTDKTASNDNDTFGIVGSFRKLTVD